MFLSLSVFFYSCSKKNSIESINENELFSLQYGNFEQQLGISDLNKIGNVSTGIYMSDGFFYVVDGESKKIMEMNSYGDLLTLFYNEDSSISRLLKKSADTNESIHKEISYPFDYPGIITVDSKKCIYTVCTIPRDRQEQSEDGKSLYSQTILRFLRDGTSVDYIGQQGPGGTPFPFIKNIYTTSNDELVVVCVTVDGMSVYWFAADGFLKYLIPINLKDVPKLKNDNLATDSFYNIDNIIPSMSEYKLYVKIDYFSTYFDADSKVQSGIDYVQTQLCTLDINDGIYEDTISIPPYEESVVSDYSRLTYKLPYDFLGVTKSGWKFFIVKTEYGFNIEMIQNENQRILRRHFAMNHKDILYYDLSLSKEGIVTALYLKKDNAHIVWYRTDELINSLLK
ncbi:MAG: hypothetical protein GX677_06075 [Treponema sp.]|nr:hypothetical protein [Treponema sp.]